MIKILSILAICCGVCLAGTDLGQYADSLLKQPKSWKNITRIAFLKSMDSAVKAWPDSIQVMNGTMGSVYFTVSGRVLTESQMQDYAVSKDFIGHSWYMESLMGFLSDPLLEWRRVNDKIACRLHVLDTWNKYKKILKEMKSDEDEIAKAIVDSLFPKNR